MRTLLSVEPTLMFFSELPPSTARRMASATSRTHEWAPLLAPSTTVILRDVGVLGHHVDGEIEAHLLERPNRRKRSAVTAIPVLLPSAKTPCSASALQRA